MANGRNPKSKGRGSSRDAGSFVALPWTVLDSQNYQILSANARSLLIELARQYTSMNNGRLLLSRKYLSERGWKSSDMIAKGKKELLDGGFIHETAKGHRPNKASWYAITWQAIDHIPGYDAGALVGFRRSAYTKNVTIKNTPVNPSHGTGKGKIVPLHGSSHHRSKPQDGAIEHTLTTGPTPQYGHHLELPSPTDKQARADQLKSVNKEVPLELMTALAEEK